MMSREIVWTVGDGRQAKIIVEVKPMLNWSAEPKAGTAEIHANAYLANEHMGCTLTMVSGRKDDVVARFDRLGIRKAQYDQYLAAIAEAKQDADLIAYETRMEQIDADIEEYKRHTARMDAAMTLNGRSY